MLLNNKYLLMRFVSLNFIAWMCMLDGLTELFMGNKENSTQCAQSQRIPSILQLSSQSFSAISSSLAALVHLEGLQLL